MSRPWETGSWESREERLCVLLLAAGERWESEAMAVVDADPGLVVLKRCVDVDDLLAAASSGQGDVAVVSLTAPLLDPGVVNHLRRHAVRVIGVVDGPADDLDAAQRAGRLGLGAIVSAQALQELPALACAPDDQDTRPPAAPSVVGVPGPRADSEPVPEGRVVAVWGPAGAPGRTTVAVNLAVEVASRARPAVLVDLDPQGGTVAQHLGMLEEVSGLLSAARLAASGQLEERFATVGRGIGSHLGVVTGLPRADRWREVQTRHVEEVVDCARRRGEVVLDVGSSLEDDPAADFAHRPPRHAMTLTALDVADEVVAVGTADPVGLTRLARGLVELRELVPETPVRVVVNRMRSSIGWSRADVAAMVEDFASTAGLHFLPDDRGLVDRAMMAGRAAVEQRDSALARGVAEIADSLWPDSLTGRRTATRGLRPRRAGTTRRR
jgi:MinD-like ATPase involved in chromosome partitioning or flagellar assembly